MLTPTISSYRCRFTVDLHVNPTRKLVASFKKSDTEKSVPKSNVHGLASSSIGRRGSHGLVETYGAAWPPGKPSDAIVFEVAKHDDFPSPPLDSDTLDFFVSRQFTLEFEIDSSREYIFKELENCPTLQLVVLHGPCHLVQEAQTRQWQSRWCESLVRRGGDLGGLTVTDTRPTRFGVVTLNTQMIIFERRTDVQPRRDSEPSTGDCDQLILRSLLRLPHRFHKGLRLMAKDTAETIDPDRCVYLSERTMSRLGLQPLSWARLEVHNVKRVVRAVPSASVQEGLEDGVVLASPQLSLNLSGSQLEVPCALLPIKSYPMHHAIELSVALVKSPNYVHSTDFSDLLKWHFARRPRLLCKGDVFAVSQKEFAEHSPDVRTSCAYLDEAVVYFVVGSIAGGEQGEPESLWCDYQRCTLYQSGATVAKVPRCMELVLDRTYHPVFNAPTCVFPDVRELLDMVKLFFTKKQMSHTLQPLFLISGSPNSGKTIAVKSIARALGLHLYTVREYDLTGTTPAAAETKIRGSLEKALSYGPCLLHLPDVEDVFRNVIDAADTRLVSAFLETLATLNRFPGQDHPVVIIATSTDPNKIPSQVMSSVLHHLVVPPMTQEERRQILELLLEGDTVSVSLDLEKVSEKTAGFVLGDLSALVEFARKSLYRRQTNGPTMVGMGCSLAAPILTMEDLFDAMSQIQKNHSKSIGAPEIPSVRWEDIGGLESAKTEILNTIQFPLKNPMIGGSGNSLTRSGILLYGPPGTGKTLLAKAVATECSLNFLSVKGPELINMYIGQSEDNVRKVFEKARSAAPCVIFFDELDSLAPRRGRSGDSGGVMDRVVSQLLAEMDGLGKRGAGGGQVFVIGATNRPDLLDTAILRPGRLDRLVYVDIPEDAEVKYKVLKALTRKLTLRDVDLQQLSEACPPHLTGADLYSLCASAMINAVRRCIDTHSKNLVVVNADFQLALEKLTPSVSSTELRKYRTLRDTFAC